MKMLINESLIKAAAKEYGNDWRPLIDAEPDGFRAVLCESIVDWVELGVISGTYAKREQFVRELFPNFYY